MTYEKLAPFIKDFIYREKWEELRDIQVAACDVIFSEDKNLLLSSGTASGKTEAAFLPVLTKLYENPSKSVGVLYVSPLKALINDQFIRLNDLLFESDIKVTKWHGDASQLEKNKLVKKPEGIIQTTPESLEAMLMRGKSKIVKLFSDLRYIIIDEVHYFMGDARGTQLLCILERIDRLTGRSPVRIGLSATLGDYSSAEKWLNTGTKRECATPDFSVAKKSIRLSMQYFPVKYNVKTKEAETLMNNYYNYLYECTFGKKCIIFSNSKGDVEENIANIKKIAAINKTSDIYLVHHGNISASFREFAETKMKKSDSPVVTGATVTLELGIDLGELQRIVQTGTPLSVSSFVQRLGRTGRRGNPSEMWFVFREDLKKTFVEFYKSINWNFLMCIAVIQLYVEEKWIEPLPENKLPYGILYHQTMSFLNSSGEISPAYLAQNMLSLSVFSSVTQEDYKKLLQYLIEIEEIETTENGGLLIGSQGERKVNHYDFYSVFETEREYSVKNNSEEIGTVQEKFPVGERFALGGRTWETIDIDKESEIICVKEIKGLSTIDWNSEGYRTIHTKILKKIRDILAGDTVYPYLSEAAATRLMEIRDVAKYSDILSENVVATAGDVLAVFPYLGTREFVTLSYSLSHLGIPNEPYFAGLIPVCIFVKGFSIDEVSEAILRIKNEKIDKWQFALSDKIQIKGKFNDYIPKELLKKQYIEDFLDVWGMKENVL